MANGSDEIQIGSLIKSSSFFYYFSRSRALLFASALLFAAVCARAQTKIHALTEVIEGHAVGGVTIDLVGNIYVANFGEIVWKITPEGKRHVFASGFYGASGKAIDHEGNLLQSNFYGDSITKIDRKGQATPFVTSGLNGPVGIAINKQTGDVYVANCRGNSIAMIATDGTVSSFAKSDLFSCPNGISFDREGNLYPGCGLIANCMEPAFASDELSAIDYWTLEIESVPAIEASITNSQPLSHLRRKRILNRAPCHQTR
jgi:DNA-binding beta-propeller fold protein YncE